MTNTILQNRYYIRSQLGEGMGGEVYLAEDMHLNKMRAVKCMKRVQSGMEASILKEIRQEGIPMLIDAFWEEGNSYIVMEYMEGVTLEVWLERHKFCDENTAWRWLVELSNMIACLQAQRPCIFHLDLKPSNIMITKDGKLRLIDFGAAYIKNQLKKEGCMYYGTKGYAPPEQKEGSVDERSDIYSLGKIFYYALTGISPLKPPYIAKSIRATKPELSHAIAEVVEKCIEENPKKRYCNANELISDLEKKKKERRKEEVFKKGILYFYYISLISSALIGGVFLEQYFLEGWKRSEVEYGLYVVLIIFCIFCKIIGNGGGENRVSYRIKCNYLSTAKKEIGLWCILFLLGGMTMAIQIRASTKVETIIFLKDTRNRNILIKEGSCYKGSEDLLLERIVTKEEEKWQISFNNGRWVPMEEKNRKIDMQMVKGEGEIKLSFRRIQDSIERGSYQQNFYLRYEEPPKKKNPEIAINAISGESTL